MNKAPQPTGGAPTAPHPAPSPGLPQVTGPVGVGETQLCPPLPQFMPGVMVPSPSLPASLQPTFPPGQTAPVVFNPAPTSQMNTPSQPRQVRALPRVGGGDAGGSSSFLPPGQVASTAMVPRGARSPVVPLGLACPCEGERAHDPDHNGCLGTSWPWDEGADASSRGCPLSDCSSLLPPLPQTSLSSSLSFQQGLGLFTSRY